MEGSLYERPSKSEARRGLLVSSLEAPPRSSLEGVFLSVEPDERKPPRLWYGLQNPCTEPGVKRFLSSADIWVRILQRPCSPVKEACLWSWRSLGSDGDSAVH